MPTPLPAPEKTAFINIVKAAPYPGGPKEADRLATILMNYEDIIIALTRQLYLFASNNEYLTQAIGVFDDTELQLVSIHNNKIVNSLTTVTDWVTLINCTVEGNLRLTTSLTGYKALTILGNTKINTLNIDATLHVDEIFIGSSCVVGYLNGANTDTLIQTIWLPFIKSAPSKLLSVANGTIINQLVIEAGSYFGGYIEDPQQTCAIPVTSLTYSTITHNSIGLTWVPPGTSYLFIHIYIKQTGKQSWDIADDTTGDFGNNSYTFTKLLKDTSYDFKVSVTCLNGGIADSTILTVQTTAVS